MNEGNIPEVKSGQSTMKRPSLDSNTKAKSISIGIVLFLMLLFTRDIWMGTGTIVFSDFDFGANDRIYIDKIFGLFNSQFSSMNFFNLSRLVFISPFYLLSLVFSGIQTAFLLRSIIMAVIILSGIGMYLFCDKILLQHFGNCTSYMHYFGLIAPAILYAVNPWVIFRIQHIFLLPGYACYPWILNFFLDLFREDKNELKGAVCKKRIPLFKKEFLVRESIWLDMTASIKIAVFICIGSAAIHYFFYYILTIISFGLALMFCNMSRCKQHWTCVKLFLRKNIILWLTVFLFCAYWIVPYIVATVTTSLEPNNVNVIDTLDMFSRNSSIKNILYLISYWWPMFNFTKHLDLFFWISGGVFLFLVIYIAAYRFNKHFFVAIFAFAAIVMIILASGVKNTFMDDLNIFIVTRIPVIGHIFRDPNKLVGPFAAFFCILLAFSINRYLFLLERSGYGRIIQSLFLMIIIIAHFFYVRPFITVFMQAYYSGSEVPAQYSEVNENFSSEKGKILWIPNMDNMVLSDGITNYTWNTSGETGGVLGLVKTAGDFHQYSSMKNELFQFENNDGVISYFYSFIQYMLDRTGAQHLGGLLSWAGFNEVGFHNDVYKQEERQAFNLNVLNAQKDMKAHYKNDIFTLYDLEETQEDVFSVNRSAYLTEDLYSFLYLMDEKDRLGITPRNTAILWSKLKKYEPVDITPSDLMIGDNKLDFIMPFIEDKYFCYPFDEINTGNPNVGWAKTMVKESEWYWILRVNNIADQSFDYDYGRGFVYTNVSHKLSLPFNKIPVQLQDQLIYTKDILSDFFIPDNPDIMRLTVFPEVDNKQGVLQGKLVKGFSGNNIWQVAKSRYMDVSSIQGGFISIRALVSGVNAGSINFKIYFYDENDEEVGVAYAGKPNSLSEFIKTNMVCDTYVPNNARRMRIDILNIQDTAMDTTFWIHDFRIYNVSSFKQENAITVKAGEKSRNHKYKVYVRAFMSEASNGIVISDDNKKDTIELKSSGNGFQWIDAGLYNCREDTLKILPKDGLTMINSVVMLPSDRAEDLLKQVQNKMNGQQMDFSLVSNNYETSSSFPVKGLKEIRIFPNTINGSFELLNSGEITKQIDILKKDEYQIALTGNIPRGSKVSAQIINRLGQAKEAHLIDTGEEILRNFNSVHYAPIIEKDKYFLDIRENISNKWGVKKYTFAPVTLEPGTYSFTIKFNTEVENMLKSDSLHLIQPDEIIIPEQMLAEDDEIISFYAINPVIREEVLNGTKAFINTPSRSRLWIIYAQNRVEVKKGELVGIRMEADTAGLKDIHGKLMWMDQNKSLVTTSYVSFDEEKKEFYLICESPVTGYLQPCYFVRSDSANTGKFSLTKSELYILDDFSKIEGTTLIPTELGGPVAEGALKKVKGIVEQLSVEDGRFVIQNEAYNRLFRFNGLEKPEPVIMNFLHNGFITDSEKKKENGFITIIPAFFILYYFFVLISLSSILLGLVLLKVNSGRKGELLEYNRTCSNCTNSRRVMDNSDLFCSVNGAVVGDFVCTKHQFENKMDTEITLQDNNK